MTIVSDCCFGAGGGKMGILVEAVWRMVLRNDWNAISGDSTNMVRLLRFRFDCCDCWDCEIDSSVYDVFPMTAM